MAGFSLIKRFNDISIAKKLYFAVGIMAVLIAIELFTLWFAITTLSSLRAYVEGEGLWSKGQKDAIYHLQKYSRSHNEQDYLDFQKYMKVPLGDHKTRIELLKPNPDLNIARQGFIEGRNHPDDINGMITLIRRFHGISYIKKAIMIWGEADPLITQLVPIGEKIHDEINSPAPSQEKIDQYMPQLESLNDQLTVLEDNFSYTLGEGSRWLEGLILRLLFVVALTVEISGLILTISVSRAIQRGLNEIIRAARAIAKGNLGMRAKAYSKDEIGTLANSFNQMADNLEKSIAAKRQATEALKGYAMKLEHSNNSLEQFAYVTSHDLQEPLRTITNYAGLLEKKHQHDLDAASYKYLGNVVHASNRMKILVRDLLHYSRLGKYHIEEQVDCQLVVKEILTDMAHSIQENNAIIRMGNLPVLHASKTEISQLLQNLISNAIKYRRKNAVPVIEIKAKTEKEGMWLFSIKDNGIGIDNQYKERIFVIFQRLHNEKEYPGTGIGLATCKKIVEMNGGKIWVESELDKGSTFYFTLPKSV